MLWTKQLGGKKKKVNFTFNDRTVSKKCCTYRSLGDEFKKKKKKKVYRFHPLSQLSSSGPDIGRSLRVMTCGRPCDLADLSIQVFSHALDPRGQ